MSEEENFGTTRSNSSKSFSSADSDRSDSYGRDRSQSLLLSTLKRDSCNINKNIENSLIKERAHRIFEWKMWYVRNNISYVFIWHIIGIY